MRMAETIVEILGKLVFFNLEFQYSVLISSILEKNFAITHRFRYFYKQRITVFLIAKFSNVQTHTNDECRFQDLHQKVKISCFQI